MDHMETKEHLMFSGDEKADAELCEAAVKLGIVSLNLACLVYV
jgi:hypothetical protein